MPAAAATAGGAAASPWPDLPPELVREISGHLDVGGDVVRFHAVCRAWRDTLDRPLRFPPWRDLPPALLHNVSGRLHAAADHVRFHAACRRWHDALCVTTRGRTFLPWLLAPSSDSDGGLEDQLCRCVFSRTSSRAPGICVRDRRVAFDDGTAGWLVSSHGETWLANPLNAERLPFSSRQNVNSRWPGHRHRVVSRDDTVLVYDFAPLAPGPDGRRRSKFKGQVMWPVPPGQADPRPGREPWRRRGADLDTDRCCAAAGINGGAVVLVVDLASCYILQPAVQFLGDSKYYMIVTGKTQAALPDVPPGGVRRWSYLVEFEANLLLLASVIQEDRPAGDLSVSLHSLHLIENPDDGGKTLVVGEWRRWDDSDQDMSRLREQILFLGFPGSFAVDADLFDGELSGGAAYFVLDDDNSVGGQGRPCSVYRYSFGSGAATLVETLPAGWNDARCMWFIPELDVWWIPELKADCGSIARRRDLRIYAGDLPTTVDNHRLREMFSKYGKVAGARIAYDKRGRSRGFGFVTMATQRGFDKAMAAINAVEEPHDDEISYLEGFLGLLTLVIGFALLYSFCRAAVNLAGRFLM